MSKVDATFLEPFLVHPDLLSWNPSSDAPDLVKKTIDVLTVLRDDPITLKEKAIREMMEDKDSQIGRKENYWAHISDTGGIYKQLVEELGSKKPDLDLPSPELAGILGLVHDLSKIYARYDEKYKQYDSELTWYFQARHLGLEDIAKKVAMHDGSEILEMIKAGKGFSGVDLYQEWTKVLNDLKNPLCFDNIKSEFALYLQGQGNLPLIVLTLSDLLDTGRPFVDLANLDEVFQTRMQDIEERHYGEEPSAMGIALMEKGGKDRFESYLKIIKDLLEGRFKEYEGFLGLWKG